VFTALTGLVLWGKLGQAWEDASYDYLFRFGSPPPPTNNVVLILMDNASYQEYKVERTNHWPRPLHTKLLERLAEDKCRLVVMDILFKDELPDLDVTGLDPTGQDPPTPILTQREMKEEEDERLIDALRSQGNVILRDKAGEAQAGPFSAVAAESPDNRFLMAAAGWGIAVVDGRCPVHNVREYARKIWQLTDESPNLCSLPVAAARLLGKQVSDMSETRWLRYYSESGGWTTLSYCQAMAQASGYFSDKIVFVGADPKTPQLGDETDDEFGTPYSRWNSVSAGGVKILATTFLNLVNEEWLRRPPEWAEFLGLIVGGVLLGLGFGGLDRSQSFGFGLRIGTLCGVALVIALAVMCSAVATSFHTNYWFPWLVVAGGQVPVALAWTVACAYRVQPSQTESPRTTEAATEPYPPPVPGFEYLTTKWLGGGSFGKVWLVRAVTGELNALKIVQQSGSDTRVWCGQTEFEALQKYKPISNDHPGLLHVYHVDRVTKPNGSGYFYYVMELGDSLEPGWEEDPDRYVPANLASMRFQLPGKRLPVRQCIDVMLPLTQALHFLHGKGLTHRDIKPENIVFVKGCPKLADIGLVTRLRKDDEQGSRPGTLGYMPPENEPVGTVAADIYALGMVLYVISNGRQADSFPMIKTTLMESSKHSDFVQLNQIIAKATQPDPKDRYRSAAEMHAALQQAKAVLAAEPGVECGGGKNCTPEVRP
jgi:CHASE2 domain-containing sensor protein